ncbi:unnamed protein product [Rotaria sp. Silwood1]|nr:unnamed protein product [Rotaria sp. Silwood1]CAF1289963.1 unnamed protein product [Rotaria sp. Silwood1]CAF1294357.1 unnamed protein product [Rotaria sp. Silwood1]CAF3488047.1 unnamed protein product [Rotaria sp. Silwood1]CAF3527486.1 unnamed protein product [Rotaria sp. Silwood1]
MATGPSPRQIIIRVTRKSDGKTMAMNIPETDNRKVKYIKSQLKHLFHPNGKFHLYYKGRHIKSRHKLSYYGITSQQSNIEIILN